MELVRRIDRAGRLQQVERRPAGAPRRLDHRLVLGRVLVGLEQDPVELLAHRRRAAAGGELGRPGVDLRRDLLLALDAEQRRLDDLLGRLLEVALAEAAEVVRRLEQAEQRRGLLLGAGRLRRSSRAPARRRRTRLRARIPRRGRGRCRRRAPRPRRSAPSGSGLAKRSSTLAALTLTRLPESSSICSELSVSLITRPARNLPASSIEGIHGAPIVAEAPARARAGRHGVRRRMRTLSRSGPCGSGRGCAARAPCARPRAAKRGAGVGMADRQAERVGRVLAGQAGQAEQAHHHRLHLLLASPGRGRRSPSSSAARCTR